MYTRTKFQFRKRWMLILLLPAVLINTGCFHEFYKTVPSDLKDLEESMQTTKDRYYVIHYRDDARHLAQPTIWDGKLEGQLQELSDERWSLILRERKNNADGQKQSFRYRPDEKFVLKDVHLYIYDVWAEPFTTDEISLPPFALEKIYIYRKDQAGTILSHIGPFIAAPIAAGAALGLVFSPLDFDLSGFR